MKQGAFRTDLYYRLAGFELAVPPLRQCPEDVPHLVEYFLRRCAHERGIHVRGITVKAYRRLLAHAWPGNTRELQHEIRRLVYDGTRNPVFGSPPLCWNRLKQTRPGSFSPSSSSKPKVCAMIAAW